MKHNYFKHSLFTMLLSLLALIGIGKAVAQTYTTYTTGVTTPAGLTFDTSGNLYVCQYTTTNGNVAKVSPNGTVITFSQTTVTNLSAIVNDGVGNFYINEADFRLYVGKINSSGTASILYTAPQLSGLGIAINNSGNIFFWRSGGTIYQITPAGSVTYLVSSGLPSITPTLDNFAGMAFDAAGNLYAGQGSTVYKITPAGTVSTFATLSVSNINSLAIDKSGNIFLGGTFSGIYKVDPSGTVSSLSSLSGLSNIYGLTFDKSGYLYASGFSTNTIYKIDLCSPTTSTTNLSVCPSALPYTWNGLTFTAAGTQTAHLQNAAGCDSAATLNLTISTLTYSNYASVATPAGLTFDTTGNLFVVQYSTSGGNIMKVNSGGSVSTFSQSTLTYASSLVTDNSGSFYANNSSGGIAAKIWNITSAGVVSTSYLGYKTDQYFGLTIDSAKNLLLLSGGQRIIKIAPNYTSSTLSVFVQSGMPLYNGLGGMAFDVATGNLYVGTISTIYKINAAGTVSTLATLPVSNIISLVVDAAGNILAGGTFSGIYKVTPAGTVSTISSLSALSDIYGLTFDKSGNLFASGFSANTIYKISSCPPITSITNDTICSSALPFIWHGKTLTGAGTLRDSLTSVAGYDSIATLNLTVKAASTSVDSLSVCPSALPYTWNGLIFRAAGTQTAHLTNSVGCDSAATLILSVSSPNYRTYASVSNPAGLTFDNSGNLYVVQYAASGNVMKVSTGGGVSVFSQTLLPNNPAGIVYDGSSNFYISHSSLGSGFYAMTTTGVKTYSYQVINGTSVGIAIDSSGYVYILTNTGNIGKRLPPNLPAPFASGLSTAKTNAIGGMTFDAAGNLYAGYDSIVYKITPAGTVSTLAILSVSGISSLTIDASGNIFLGGTFNGIYKVTPSGTVSSITSLSALSNVYGLTFDKSGNLFASGFSTNTIYKITFCPPLTSTTNDTICSSALPFIWNGKSLTGAGTYRDTLTSVAGYDSIATLNLTVKAASTSVDSLSVCPAAVPYTWNGLIFKAAGTQTAHLTNSVGCDSAAMLILSVGSPNYSTYASVANPAGLTVDTSGNLYVCQYATNGNIAKVTSSGTVSTFTQATLGYPNAIVNVGSGGFYVDQQPSTNLNLYQINSSGAYVSSVLIMAPLHSTSKCNALAIDTSGDVFTLGNAGFIVKSTASGVNTVLTSGLNPTSTTTIGGMALDAVGNIYAGYDSIIYKITPAGIVSKLVTLSGSNINSLAIDKSGNIFIGGTFNGIYKVTPTGTVSPISSLSALSNIYGLTFDKSGNLFASGYSTNTIYKITFCPPLTSTTYDTICASALPFTWNGKTLTGAGTLRDTLTSAAGYDSIAVLNLIIKPSPTVYNLTGGGSFCAGGAGVPVVLSGSQTSVHYSVFVNGVLNPKYKQGTGSPLSGTLQNPGTYTMKATDTITGCTANMTGSVTVIVNQPTTSSISISNCGSYTWHNKVLTSTGTYYDTLKAANSSGCDSIITLNLTIKNSPTVYTLSGGGSFCAGGAGVPVSLSGSQTSVFYTVFINGIATNDTVNGMGIPLSGKLQYPGIYTLKANDTITGCMVFMNGSVTVIVNQPTISVTTINNCDNYVWHNKVLTNSGVYHDTLKGANSNGCDSITTLNLTISPSVSGNIISPLWKPIPSVIATLKSNNMVYNTYSNNYKFTCTNNGSNDTIHLTKNNDVNKANGVTALDIALVQSHILGKSILSSPYKIIAADVSGDGKVTALDIVYLKRLILGIDTTFTNSTTKQTRLWTFVDSSYKFPDTTNPFPYKDSIVVTGLSTSKTNQTFIGCKMGDVNWDWNPAIARPMVNNIDAVELSYSLANTYPSDALAGRTDGYVHIPIRVKNFREMLGMQYTISFNASVLKWVGVDNNVLNFEMGTNHAEEGKLSFLWVDTKNEIKTLEDGSVIMELVFKTIKPFNNETLDLDGSVTSVVAYDKDYQMHNVMFKPSVINSLETKDVWSVAPNPTTEGVIHLQMNLADRKIVVLRLIDNTGRLLLVKQVEGVKGINIITLKEGNVPSGTYYLQAVGVEGVKQILIQ